MVNVTQNVLTVAVAVAAAMLFQAGLNRIWPSQERRSHNELIGWQLTILGTTYAVILGFMLYAVWTALREADLNTDFEANAVVDIYRLAAGLPEPQRTRLQTLARSYADTVIAREWPQMAAGVVPEQTGPVNSEMWNTVMSLGPASIGVASQEMVLSELVSLDQHRSTRIMQSATRLPNVLWCVLLAGGVLTIISACSFGAENMKLQTLEVVSFSLLISLSLVAIADIHRPFHGLIHVRSVAFERARECMR